MAVFACALASDGVSRVHGVERAEAGAASHVACQTVLQVVRLCQFKIEKTAVQKQIAGGAYRSGCTPLGHQVAVTGIQMQAVGVDRTFAQQTHVLVNPQIAARLREQVGHPLDFIGVLRHMGLHPDAGVARSQLACTAQLRLAGGGCKTRRDGVAQAIHTVPSRYQRFGFIQALLGAHVAQSVGAVAVLQHTATEHAQLSTLRLLEKRIHRGGVGGGKGQGRGHAVAQQFIEKEVGDFMRMGRVGKACFLREGVVVQPRQEAIRG